MGKRKIIGEQMVKKKHKKQKQVGTLITIGLGLGALICILLLWQLFGKGTSHIVGKDTNMGQNALSTQLTTTTRASTSTTLQTQETTQKKTMQTETTVVATIDGAETRTTNRHLTRLDAVGNSGLEFDTLDEATDYAEKMVNNPKSLAKLQRSGYSGYAIRSVRWTNNTVTYTIDWR